MGLAAPRVRGAHPGRVKILHVIAGLGIGGAERALLLLTTSHAESAHFEHVVVSLTTFGVLGEELRASGVRVVALNMRSLLGSPRGLWRLRNLIRLESPDIVQTWMYHADVIGGLAARLAGNSRIIWGVRATDMVPGSSSSAAVFRRLATLLSHRVPSLIVCAAEASSRTHQMAGYDPSRITVIPNGFVLDHEANVPARAASLRAELGWDVDTVVIGCVGRFDVYKDHLTFIQAAGAVARRFPATRFLMVGAGLEHSNRELAAWIGGTGCPDRFALLGTRRDVPVCLAAMDIFCLSSRSEGFPNVVGEAMAMSLPCVTTDVGDAALLVADTGFIVPKENPAALAEGLGRFVAMPAAERRRLGHLARERIDALYSVDLMRKRFEAAYARVRDAQAVTA